MLPFSVLKDNERAIIGTAALQKLMLVPEDGMGELCSSSNIAVVSVAIVQTRSSKNHWIWNNFF